MTNDWLYDTTYALFSERVIRKKI